MVKWKKSDVIKAFNEAMNPTPNVGVGNQLLEQLRAKAQEQKALPTTKIPLVRK